ncbi:MAG: tyrosine--tRNA ligase [Bacteroidota bacterium]|jgi:tyrosyl-tRNA synthetase
MKPLKSFVEELKWRTMLHDLSPGTEDLLNREIVKGYIGFDPTADSLGIGNMVQIMTLVHFQRCGHKPIALVGGATGMVGDPSGKSSERNLLDEETLRYNLSCQKRQLEKFLDFNCGENSAEIVNNYDWFSEMTFLEFLREVGKHITVNYMKAKDSVKNRIERSGEGGEIEGMSFTEFTYQLVQGYDFFWLWKNRGVKLQMGGSDQYGNITTGIELIRRKAQGEAFTVVTPLIKKADGSKFGKTEGGNIWLDPNKTSPYKFYQFWLNASDEDVKNYFRIFSLKGQEEILALENEHARAPHLRILQKELGKEMTIRVHSENDYNLALEATEILFGKGTKEALSRLSDEMILNVFEGVPRFNIPSEELSSGIPIITLLAEKTNILPSKSEAKKMVLAGAVSINKEKIVSADFLINEIQLLNGKYLLAQKGKKDYFLIVKS